MEPLDTCRSCCRHWMLYLQSNLGNSCKTTVISMNRTAKGHFFFLSSSCISLFCSWHQSGAHCSAYEQTGEQSLLQSLVYPFLFLLPSGLGFREYSVICMVFFRGQAEKPFNAPSSLFVLVYSSF